MDINAQNRMYKTDEGSRLAVEELVPVVRRYLGRTKHPRILEVGCGFGRNIEALSSIPGADVYGCDFSNVELKKARERLDELKRTNVTLVHQKNENRLPFDDDSFDAIVCWQVLEHVLSRETKKRLIGEMVRVLKSGGFILIETPNFWFPVDYHDNRMLFVHWLLPMRARHALTTLVRNEDFPPSQYTSIYELRRMLRRSQYVRSFKQRTCIYFEERYSDVFRHMGGTNVLLKKIFFAMYYLFYLALRLFGLKGDLFTPSVRVVFQVRKV
ncbi:hypothetical protein A3D73_01615 [Candidatus Uhrbacteria bacterium RIFCSPHIGHO2_02_FULL_60_44]|nr:MAG: hypothetical protein A3D73_01615 [Candidatus Uhrbacteria bacterium RIFCSPHIGHO2_02_FULL_60_44]